MARDLVPAHPERPPRHPRDPGPDAGDSASLLGAMVAKAQRFDIPSLLAALTLLAARRKSEARQRNSEERPLAVRFESHPSQALHPSLIERIELVPGSRARDPDELVIAVNWGLRSAVSGLPSYFVDLLDSPAAGEPLSDLLAALDRALLRLRFEAHGPADSPGLFGDPQRLRADVFELSRPASSTTLHWVFSKVFPELSVAVRRTALRLRMQIDNTILGESPLGSTTLGGAARVPVHAFDVILRVSELWTWTGGRWPEVVRERLRAHVLPALARSEVHLRVLLIDPEAASQLALRQGSHLGFDPLAEARRPMVQIVFEGRPVRAVTREGDSPDF